MFAHTYEAFWREQNSSTWNRITSPSPITWNQVVNPAVTPVFPFRGGQCPGNYDIAATWTEWNSSCTTTPRSSSYVGSGAGPFTGQITQNNWPHLKCAAAPYTDHFLTGPNLAGGRMRIIPGVGRGVRLDSVTFRRANGQPDNCGDPQPTTAGQEGNCQTTFSTGLVITRPQCIVVVTSIPECPCCTSMLPRANAILARL